MKRHTIFALLLLMTLGMWHTNVLAAEDNSTETAANVSVNDSISEDVTVGDNTQTNTKILSKEEKRQEKLDQGKWKSKKKHIYYYNSDGKKVTGLVTIKKRQYYFDKKGIQRTGWQKINNDYYFFKTENEHKGYMVTSKKINGITLDKNGKAKCREAWQKDKLKLMVQCSEIIEQITNSSMTKLEKLRAAYKYEMSSYHILGSPHFHNSVHWDVIYAARILRDGHGACYEYGALFAYLANAVGYKKCYAVSSGGHGWAEVDGKVSDPNWDISDRHNTYFQMDMNLSGHGGRPSYKSCRMYVKRI